MATNMEIKVQKQLIPYSNHNGVQTYRDYGFQLVSIYDTLPEIPVLMFSGLAPSGANEIDWGTPKGFSSITGQLEPKIRHISGRGEDATGLLG